jgi:hypothetical protein
VGTLQTANVNINSAAFFGTFQFVPVVDDTFITQRPQLSLAQKKVNGVRASSLSIGQHDMNVSRNIESPAGGNQRIRGHFVCRSKRGGSG